MKSLETLIHLPVFVTFTEGLGLGVVLLDKDGRIAYWNTWLEEHTGLRRNEVMGKEGLVLTSATGMLLNP